MKPKDLIFPFSWENRRPLFEHGVLFIPRYYQEHDVWNKTAWFSVIQHYPCIHIEYGSGNGAWICSKAKKEQEVLWIAVEKRFDRVQKIWSKKQNEQLHNLLIVCGDALSCTQWYLPESCLDKIFINFPDPWPKEKHAKNRLLQTSFVHAMHAHAKEHAQVMIVTDDDTYREQVLESMTQQILWKSLLVAPNYVTTWPEYGSSFFEELWRQKGKTISYMHFQKQKGFS